MALAIDFSVGINAPTFPRDPLNINIYQEHILIGQILEPLFTLGDDGLVTGALADKWEFSNKQTELIITLRDSSFFSNGQPVTSEDVKFSIERHLQNPTSQSYNYLHVIKAVSIINDKNLKIVLRHKYVPILLALSRDHLGILPKSWVFNSESNEPFIGSGPYRIVKEAGAWYLVSNSKYRSLNEIKIKRWRVDIIDPIKNILPTLPSDLFITASKSTKELLLKKYPQLQTTHYDVKSFSFFQTSFWWLGNNYKRFKNEQRVQINTVLTLLSQAVGRALNCELSTGIVPYGILGSLHERPKLSKKINFKKVSIEVAVPEGLSEIISAQIFSTKELKDSGVIIKINAFPLHELARQKESSNDLVLISYAGGFFDPEGYLTVLPSMLGRTSKELFGTKAEAIRLKAEKEFDSAKRAALYREFSEITQKEIRYIAGWAPSFSELRNSKLNKSPTAYKYSYKLINYLPK